jgi:hypothetical protein
MILFYSDHCTHSKMLLDTVKKLDHNKIVKFISIDYILNKNLQLDPKITSVPALMLLPSKDILFGKEAFDHLLLPTRGKLFQKVEENTVVSNNNEVTTEPNGFSIGYNSQNFEAIQENEELPLNDINFSWSDIAPEQTTPASENKYSDKKGNLPSIDEIRSSRENDLQHT